MKVIYSKNKEIYIKEISRQIDRNTNFFYCNISTKPGVNAVITEEFSEIERVQANIAFSKLECPTLWNQLKDLSRSEMITWFYQAIAEYKPKLSRWQELNSQYNDYCSTQENGMGDINVFLSNYSEDDKNIWNEIIEKRASPYCEILFFVEKIQQLNPSNKVLFDELTIGDL